MTAKEVEFSEKFKNWDVESFDQHESNPVEPCNDLIAQDTN